MPASSSDGRGKWKRRKRDAPVTRKAPKREDLAEDDEEDDPVEEEAHLIINNNNNKNNLNSNVYNSNQDEGDDLGDPRNPKPGRPPEEAEVLVDSGVRVCDFPRVTRMVVNRLHGSVRAMVALERANLMGEGTGRAGQGAGVSLENVSYGQLQAVSAVPAESVGADLERSEGPGSGCVIAPPRVMEGRGVVKRFGSRVHVVPMHSDWFSPATVHRLERQAVPHFFSGKSPDKPPEKYMECRNYIVAKYMENPEKRLAVSDCQGLVSGIEDEDLTRIVRFLDHWGIINYCANPPSCESWNFGSYLREDPNGEIHVPSASLKSIDSLVKLEKPKCRLKVADVYKSVSCHETITDLDTRLREHLSENRCHCCSQPLPNLHYQSQKEVDVLLCSSCFHEGRFVTGHSGLDFVKVDSRKDYGDPDGETWSDQETLLLLEAMEIYNENWNEIADYVGTKSKAQCVLHFLRLPMEDGLLDNIEIPSMSKSTNQSNGDDYRRLIASSSGSYVQDAESESNLPFANSGNPVMALVAFLTSAVGPRVAAACAHASLAALCGDNQTDSDRLDGRVGNSHEPSNSLMPKDDIHHVPPGDQEPEATTLSVDKVKDATKAGLAAAAMKAKLFADHEEREIQRLSANIINHQLKRLELKLKQFAEVETFLMRECEQVEKARQRFAAERARLLSTGVSTAGITSQMNLPSASASIVNNDVATSRQQMMATSSQPSISGYATANQQAHPSIPFMQRGQQQQPVFPIGPRLPLSSIQPSTSGSSNAMFSAGPGNSQPNLNQMLRSASAPRSGFS